MVKKEIYECDICGSTENVKMFSLCIDRICDAAGSMEDVVEGLDLCEKHRSRAYGLALKMLTREQKKELFEKVKGMKP